MDADYRPEVLADSTMRCPYAIAMGNFTLNEFCRLVLLFSQNDTVRKALLDSAKERTREQLD